MDFETSFFYEGKEYVLKISSTINAARGSTNLLYYIFIDNYYKGRIYKKNDRWYPLDEFKPDHRHPFIFDSADIQTIGDLIDEHP